jgi:hypothetical protein
VKLNVTITPLDEAALVARARDLATQRRAQTTSEAIKVRDGQRELGTAAGDSRQPDGR